MESNLLKYHKMYGKHSNIPYCCITFWCTEWESVMSFYYKSYVSLWESVEAKLGKTYGYIPCPKCLENKRWNKLHVCDKKACHTFRKLLKNKTGLSFWY